MTDAAGRVRSRYDYTAFGEDYDPGVTEDILQRYGYTGRERIGASTVLGYRNRQYHPALGRFGQRDPAGTAGGVNLYGYVENQPSRYVDPYGLWLTDTHVEIQLQAIREEFGLECDPGYGCPPSIKATFRAAHAYIDSWFVFIINTAAHGLTVSRTTYDDFTELGPELIDKLNRDAEQVRIRNLIEDWIKSIHKLIIILLTTLSTIDDRITVCSK